MRIVRIAVAVALLLPGLASAGTPHDSGWQPGPAPYAVQEIVNVPFTTSDGVQLTGSLYYPADPATGQRVDKHFPVLIDMDPYGGAWGMSGGTSELTDLSVDSPLRYFASHGYIGFEMDARGTGRSEGDFSALDPKQLRDELELIDYAAHQLTGSNGVVGLTGMSYRGLNQLLVGGLLRRGTPVRAIGAASAGASAYADPFFDGGIPSGFWYAYGGIEGLSSFPGADEATAPNGADPAHVARLATDRGAFAEYVAEMEENTASGGYFAHRDQWWLRREPIYSAPAIVRAGVPVLLTTGTTDFFPRGALHLYAAFQNLVHGRSMWAPMDPRMQADPRYQLVYSDSYTDGDWNYWLSYELQWYDHWLKGIANGVGAGNATLHMQEFGGTNRWVTIPHGTYPPTKHYTPYYLGAGGKMSATNGPASSATLAWAPGQSLTYTTTPFEHGATIAGPVSLTVNATSTAADVELIGTLNDVAPDGTVTTTVPGFEVDAALIGSQRAVDAGRSWYDDAGRLIAPYHPYATATEEPVPTGKVVRYTLELWPRLWSVQPGHQLQLVLTSQDVNIAPTAPQVAGLAGGVYTIQLGGRNASYLDVPVLPFDAFPVAADPTVTGLGN